MSSSSRAAKVVWSLLLAGVVFASQEAVRAQVALPDLANATLEELMNIRVTSAARIRISEEVKKVTGALSEAALRLSTATAFRR